MAGSAATAPGTDIDQEYDTRQEEAALPSDMSRRHAGHYWENGWRVFNPDGESEAWWIEVPPVLPPADPGYLCELCRHIDFKQIIREPETWIPSTLISLGSLRRCHEQLTCSFCSLVANATVEQYQETPDCQCLLFRSEDHWQKENCSQRFNALVVQLRNFDLRLKRVLIHAVGEEALEGRELSRYVLDAPIPRDWLETCERKHASNMEAVVISNLTFVDVEQKCLVSCSGICRYATLSYVWGGVQHTQYTRNSEELLRTPGGLLSATTILPQTIKDAIILTADLGIRYLWVDSLCIRQDDPPHKDAVLKMMGNIYRDATLTIVDALGSHADYGLFGVSCPREDTPKAGTVQGMQLIAMQNSPKFPFRDLYDSKWLSRAWTYQEMMLSHRLLIVTGKQLLFFCDHAVYLEDCNPHQPSQADWILPGSLFNWGIGRLVLGKEPLWSVYSDAVESYTCRHLTFEADITSAFEGILDIIRVGTSTKYLFNLPDTELDQALLWYPRPTGSWGKWIRERGNPDGEPREHLRPVFTKTYWRKSRRRLASGVSIPSWIWAGWRVETHYPANGFPTRSTAPSIPAIAWLGKRSPDDVRVPLKSQDFRCRNWRELGWQHQIYEDKHVYVHQDAPDFLFPHPVAFGTTKAHDFQLMDDSNVLHFMAFTVPISIGAPEEHGSGHRLRLASKELHTYDYQVSRLVFDEEKYRAGIMILNGPLDILEVQESSSNLGLIALSRAGDNHSGIGLPDGDPLDWEPRLFENISRPRQGAARHRAHLGHRFGDHGWSGDRGWNEDRFDGAKLYPLYNALLVEYGGDGVAHRVGLGQVHVDAFHAADPAWREVRLG